MVLLTEQSINTESLLKHVISPGAGGVAVFVGTVRDMTDGKSVHRLDFEAYEMMAISELNKIAERAREQWPVKKMGIIHRTGTLQVTDVAVAIAVSCAHRKEAFATCQFIIDTLKKTVPIWKMNILTTIRCGYRLIRSTEFANYEY